MAEVSRKLHWPRERFAEALIRALRDEIFGMNCIDSPDFETDDIVEVNGRLYLDLCLHTLDD
jgi:hypothetical protein